MSACSGVPVPDGRRCMPDGQGGHKIVCIPSCAPPYPSCPKPPGDEVCAEDYGVYPSRCHMQKETCEMYGVDVTVHEFDYSYCRNANFIGMQTLTRLPSFILWYI